MGHRLKLRQQIKKATEDLQRLAPPQNLPLATPQESKAITPQETNIHRKLTELSEEFHNKVVAVGRENSKKEIIDQLKLSVNKSGDTSFPVVTIVGVAGIGKTKLAGLVYGDEEVKSFFGLQEWVHETFLVESVATCVTEAANKGKHFLLVLDDFKDEECLQKLQQKLKEASGVILITTRSNFVANKIGGKVKPYALQGLNEEESWSLFQQIRGQGSSDIKEDIERKIVRGYCGGVPIKVITVARLINCYETPFSEEELKEDFLQELKITYYDHLPMHQQIRFVYCSLFPQDHEIDAERLVHLWMAEGFLPRHLSDPHEFGLACFNDFVPFVFEVAGRDELGDVKSYKMNRLMHELAKTVAWDDNVIVDSEGNGVHEGVVRASFHFALDIQCGIPQALFDKAKKLRTILLLGNTNNSRLPHEVKMATSTCDEIFNTFNCLRVLDLHDLGITMVPSSIGEVKDLRYLDLSHNNIEKLPSSITKLFHLQTLKLSQCHILKELPKDLEDLSCLVHLYLDGCLDLTHMPRGIGKLSHLQTMSLFVASKNYHMGGLRELADLDKLRGNLEILHLEQMKFSASLDPKDNKYLRDKKHLDCLTLRWDHDDDDEEEEEEDNEVDKEDYKSLECLEANSNLRVLCVVGYYANMFSDWLSSIQCLVKFSLNDCPNCQFLPSMDHLPHLKVLELRRLDSLKFISKNCDQTSADDAEGSSSSPSISTPFFPSLEELTISDCPKLRSWWETEKGEKDRPLFISISKLHVQCCRELHCMPLYPYLDEELVLVDSSVRPMRDTVHAKTSEDLLPFTKLKSMVIERITESPPESWLKNFTSLENLRIRDCSELKSLPQGFRYMSSLQRLSIERCPKLELDKSESEWKGLKQLRFLTIREIPKLESLPKGVENVTSLKELGLYECNALTSLPDSIGKLTSLRKLVICECKRLVSLPKGIQNLKSLDTLIITDCPRLLPRCQRETGDDWPQIKHIPNIRVDLNFLSHSGLYPYYSISPMQSMYYKYSASHGNNFYEDNSDGCCLM
uniref:Disease resistance protein RGA3 n=2 Tax=Cajanus cajan TaxID=3821 RepID=A0A151THB2_CAJCA|nr:Putative disease resistance protein RGA3 [Cajanus cajan]